MRWCGAVLLVAAAACTESEPAAQQASERAPQPQLATADSSQPTLASPWEGSRTNSDSVEAVALRGADGAVHRAGDTLVFFAARRRVVRVNNPAEGEQYVEFRYHGLLRGAGGSAFHIVDVHWYESTAVELIAKSTGDSLILAGLPLLSPNGARFAVSADSYETCEGTVQLDVWSLATTMPTRELTVSPFDCTYDRGWWPVDVTWRSSDTLTFVRTSRQKDGPFETAPGLVVRRATGWALDSASAAAVPRPPTDSL